MKNVKSILLAIAFIAIPLVAMNWAANLPAPDPAIPETYKAAGFQGINGAEFEKKLAGDSRLRFAGETAVIACPSTMLVSQTTSALCGYCKVSDFDIYPSWLPGFTMKIEPAQFDYRYFYRDSLRDRFFMLTHNFSDRFLASPHWKESKGRWFGCKNSSELDVNAYIEIHIRDGEPRYEIGEYNSLGLVRKQGAVSP